MTFGSIKKKVLQSNATKGDICCSDKQNKINNVKHIERHN